MKRPGPRQLVGAVGTDELNLELTANLDAAFVPGTGVAICDQCVALCNELIGGSLR